MNKTPRPRKCACGCGEKFVPVRPLQRAATWQCAQRIVQAKREKDERKAARVRRIELKPLSWWKAKAQAAVNAYVRERDRADNCISCGRWHEGQWHASHFKSIGANSFLRYNLWNIHKACSICNNHLSGNIGEYSKRLPGKIGEERFEYLESAPISKVYTVEYLERLARIFTKKTRRLQKKRVR